jgi:hypothetical protein
MNEVEDGILKSCFNKSLISMKEWNIPSLIDYRMLYTTILNALTRSKVSYGSHEHYGVSEETETYWSAIGSKIICVAFNAKG